MGEELFRCVVCHVNIIGDHNHHCDPKRLKKIDDARKASRPEGPREPSEYERLSMGEFIQHLNDGDE